ncbi:MAG: hypothetical protein Q8O09_02345 [Bacillota bacterium]|nr:hypothetical protein [Bacillota bacterium]
MKTINLDVKFKEYLAALAENAGEDEQRIAELGDTIPELYMEWLDSPKDFLEGKSPNAYFGKLGSRSLFSLFEAYIKEGTPLPEPLLNAIVEKGKEAEDYLIGTFKTAAQIYPSVEKASEARIFALEILTEMQSSAHKQICLDIIAGMTHSEDAEAQKAAEALLITGEQEAKEPLLHLLDSTDNIHCIRCCMDILSDFTCDERVLARLTELFKKDRGARAFYAFCLGKYGDERALPLLLSALEAPDISYYEYTAVRNAAEELGADDIPERTFDGDMDYEKMKQEEL